MLPSNQSFWVFCTNTWANTNLQQVLLNASIQSNFDVVGFLYLIWLKELDKSCDWDEYSTLQTQFITVIDQARSARRQAKEIVPPDLYNQLKSAELALEREYAYQLGQLNSSNGFTNHLANIIITTAPVGFFDHYPSSFQTQ